MDLSEHVCLHFVVDNLPHDILYIKKKKERKGFLISRKNSKLIEIEHLYPSEASKLFYSTTRELDNKKIPYTYLDLPTILKYYVEIDSKPKFNKNSFSNLIKQRFF